MSASLYADFYIPYETYPRTEYVKFHKKFGELKENDIIYQLERDKEYKLVLIELRVIKPWYKTKGHCYIQCLKNNKKYYIDFGSAYIYNVQELSKQNNIIYYKYTIVGTDKESVLTAKKQLIVDELMKLKDQTEKYYNDIDNLNKLY